MQAVHHDEAAMNLTDRFALPPAIVDGRVTDRFVKQRAERPNTLKADFETNWNRYVTTIITSLLIVRLRWIF